MRWGSLSAAEEITGHRYETIGRWLRGAAQDAQSLSEALVGGLQLSAVEVDAFWFFVKKRTAVGEGEGAEVLSEGVEIR